jgi:Second Messenger Oligonucleotide or Dinucleotide Synthetase domain
MKLAEHFDTFLVDTVNLNQARIDTLEARVETIEEFLANSDFHPRILRFSPQGSWAVRTIIKPPNGDDFDADELVFVEAVEGWEPHDYIDELHRVFHDSDRYKKLVHKGTRCVTLDYKNDFHLDVVVCIRLKDGNYVWFVVCNSRSNSFEHTDGEGFASWFAGRNAVTGKNLLRKVTRLIKYLRDIKGTTFSAKSILLATLLGNTVEDWHSQVRDIYYSDVPTALKTIVGHLEG